MQFSLSNKSAFVLFVQNVNRSFVRGVGRDTGGVQLTALQRIE